MASKNVALRKEAVERLDLLKRSDESYSDVILRVVPPRRSLEEVLEFLKAHPIEGPDTLTPRIREIRRWGNKSRRSG